MDALQRIESAIPPAAYFEFDVSAEAFRQIALRDYVRRWPGKQPFYIRRMGIAAVLCTSARDVREVLMDSARFVMRNPGLPGYDVFDVFGGLESVLQMDGERHARVRRLMQPAFNPLGLVAIKPAMERIVQERIAAIEQAGPEFDVMADFCDHLIMHALLDATFQLSKQQQTAFERVHRAIAMAPKFKPGEPRPAEYMSAMAAVRDVIKQVIDERRANPGADFISNLISARDAGNKLSDAELYGQINTICGSALGSTAASLGAALFVLGKNPEEFERLKQHPELIDSAIEECLRVQGPGLFSFPRFAACDTEVGGTKIYQGMPVITSPQAANYDPAEFDDPERFDITRKPKTLTFGTGDHHCIGIRLAKMTMHMGLLALIARFPKLRLSNAAFQPVYGGNVGTMTIARLPMRVD